jgi:hypothetical protein
MSALVRLNVAHNRQNNPEKGFFLQTCDQKDYFSSRNPVSTSLLSKYLLTVCQVRGFLVISR